MMSDTRARASRFARWFGSFDRKGLSGRRTPESPAADGVPVDGVVGDPNGDIDVGVDGGRAGVDGRVAAGTKGCAAGGVEKVGAFGI